MLKLKCATATLLPSPKKEDECTEFVFVPTEAPVPKIKKVRLDGTIVAWSSSGHFKVGEEYAIEMIFMASGNFHEAS